MGTSESGKRVRTGKVVAVQGPVVDVKFSDSRLMPELFDVLLTKTGDEREVTLEVIEHLEGNVARCIAIQSTAGLRRNETASGDGSRIAIPTGDQLYGRIINVLGKPIDGKEPLSSENLVPIRRPQLSQRISARHGTREAFVVLETGVKMIDLLFPIVKGSKNGILGGAGLGKSVLTLELIYHIVKRHQGACIFTGVGERIREGNELYHELVRLKILDKVQLVFGQMNEPPGARYGVAMTGITMAEAVRKQNKDVLLFVDNIFRFIQAGSEISALLGRVPSETGYQPTLISEAGEFHERIFSATEAGGSITSMEAVYVPADDLSDPAVVAIFSFLDSVIVLSREKVQLGLYPAIDPLQSASSNLDADIVGKRHYEAAQDCLRMFQRYEELRRIVQVIGVDELSQADRTLYERARKLQYFLTQPFFAAEAYTGMKGEYCTTEQTVTGCERILSGKVDRQPEDDFYLIGALP